MDVLSASKHDNKIAWYENTDGHGNYGDQQVITTFAQGANSVYATDLDGDGDMDVLSASWDDDKIAWYENTDGNGSFGDQQIITTNASNARSVYATDLDGDGDMDVLSASKLDNKIAWHENAPNNIIERPKNQYVLFPNPANEIIEIKSLKNKVESVKIVDFTGRIVKQFEMNNSAFRIRISDLESGLYFVKVNKEVLNLSFLLTKLHKY